MDKLRLFAFFVSMVFVTSVPARAAGEFSYDKNTFINYINCLGIYPGTSLGLHEEVWLFSMDESPLLSKVVHVIAAAEARKRLDAIDFKKAWEDKQLWAEVGCAHAFRGDRPESLARVVPELKESISIGFAIRGLPAGAWISQGKGESVTMGVKDNPYVETVRQLVTEACYAPDSLVRVKRFPVSQRHEITQLDIGKVKLFSPEKRKQIIEEKMQEAEKSYAKWAWPEEKKRELVELESKNYVESVEICRFFLDGKRVLKSEKISRSTGVGERVDTPTELDSQNWTDTTDSAIGFISLNEGKDWDALLVNVGFEGINYSIQRLNNSVVQYSRSLYTYH
jgi:hypothetical protein